MRKQHNITDLSIATVSLFSILFHFLFPSAAIAAGINKKNVIGFDFSNQVKPYKIATGSVTPANTKNATLVSAKDVKLNYAVSAIIINDSQSKKDAPAQRPAENIANNASHEEFTEYIAKDRYINAEKDALLAAGNVKIVSKKKVLITAYSSTPDQTDSSPFITAAGTHVHDGVIAANFLPFGAKVRMPSLYQNKIFTVEDRMKSNVKVDIWFSSRQEAMNFGARVVDIEIVENL